MGARVNQHFVPQYYFRNFSSNGKLIHALLTRDGRPILNASIAGQCAKRNFYGHPDIESAFAVIEQRHAVAIRGLLNFCKGRIRNPLSVDDQIHLMSAVLFQRARTEFECEKNKEWREKFALTAFREYVVAKEGVNDKDKILEALDTGQFTISANPQVVLGDSITLALKSTELITDLKLVPLKNFTQRPFIFSDSPVVLYNSHLRRVTNRGVLGLQTPGLQIFLPLSPSIVLMLIDSSVYEVTRDRAGCAHVVSPSDVEQLNALQVHHSLNAVYFKNAQDAEYVADLWHKHKPNSRSVAHVFRRLDESGLVCRGVADASRVLHSFEPQVNHELSLSFVHCNPVNPQDYEFSRRDPKFAKEFDKRMRKEERDQEKTSKHSASKQERRGPRKMGRERVV